MADGTSYSLQQFISYIEQEREHRQTISVEKSPQQKKHTFASEMWKRLKSVIILLLAIFTLNNAKSSIYIERIVFPQTMQEETIGHNRVMIEYITRLFCINGTYRFNHIYVERSLSTSLADQLIIHISKCLTAGVLVSR